MEQLMQRVKLRYYIRALSEQELGSYIRHRLSIAGAGNRALFPPETLPCIYKYAGGIPRLINTLCDTTLTCAYADNLPKITAEVVETAAKELQWPPHSERIDKRRMNVKRDPVEGGLQGMLREQIQTLTAIAAQVSKLEERSPVLESIGKSLAAIEMHLRNLIQSRSVQARPDSTVDRQKRSG
jgi:hypothetical protein